MSLQPTTKTIAYREGWQGRRRTYKCRSCGNKFQVDTLNPLPESQRYCHLCYRPENTYKFIDKATQEITEVKAGDAELATLRAWSINPNLTFYMGGDAKQY